MDTHFDVLILGTGLVQSIAAAALAKAGLTVAHIDTNAHYGGAEASLAQDELVAWCESRRDTHSVSSTTPLPSSRSYALSLAPALLPSAGPLINALVQSGVARYTQFKLLDAVFIYRPLEASLHRVPATKEDIFRTRTLPLAAKRKLMRFLQFAASDFHLPSEQEGQPFGDYLRTQFAIDDEHMRHGILYALAFCSSENDPTLPALKRLQSYIQSAGRYGNSPFLVGHYGGLGELAQGFCRTCAVNGGIYILGRPIVSLTFPTETSPASISLEEVPDVLTADIVLCDESYVLPATQNDPSTQMACATLILNCPIPFPSESESELRTAVIVIPPPPSSSEQAIQLLHMGDETLSCPPGKYILYASTPLTNPSMTPEAILHPHIAQLIPPSSIDFSCYYTRVSSSPLRPAHHPRTMVVPSLPSSWSDIGDKAASEARRLFGEIMRLKGEENMEDMWPPLDNSENDNDEAW